MDNLHSLLLIHGSINENTDILLDFYNTTNSDNENNIAQRWVLNKNSVAFQYTDIAETEFQYILTARLLPWFQIINGNSYKAVLSWVNPNNPLVTESITYNWTMSLSSEEQITEEQKTQQEINQGIIDINKNMEETNEFLKDESFNKDNIINNMPNSDKYNDPTSNSFDNFFNTLKGAFTSENYQDIVLPIPFTDGEEIIIPNNLTENIIPDLLKNLIRMVYWFILSRFIVKDISNYIEKAKSGDIFSHTDTNIKTDML